MTIEKSISFHIERQFPAIYREEGRELVQFTKEYYKFLESTDNQSLYNGRRIYEYRDVDTTLNRMLIFFKNKYLADLPFDDTTVRLIVKNILGLYRRKGTQDGLELFFRLFYNEDVKVYYPSRDMLRPSDSEWKRGRYLQMIPNDNVFTSTKTTNTYTYADIVGRTIVGETSRARAIVDKINFIVINRTLTPIIFINDIVNNFIGLEGIICEIDGIPIKFGTINGSFTQVTIDTNYKGTTGNEIGDIVTFDTPSDGIGARGLVTGVTETFTGIVEYNIIDGGWGYSVGSTSLLASNQIIFLDNTGGKFTLLETLEDTAGNRGVVIGQNDISIGVRSEPGDEFSDDYVISTVDRDTNVTLNSLSGPVAIRVVAKNESSPGQLYPETANTADVILAEIENTETVSLIFDVIGDFTSVTLDAVNYNAAPAVRPMSGTADPVTIATALEDAFDLTPVELGSIVRFDNVNPGADYVNDVFALAYDTRITLFERKPQEVTLADIPATISVGDEVTQGGIGGKVIAIQDTTITVIPYTYYGFNTTDPIVYGGEEWEVIAISTNFESQNFAGYNANIDAVTSFGVGRITNIDVIDSGYGYVHQEAASIIDASGTVATIGTISARGQGSTGGYWASLDSHLNGYTTNNGTLTYFDSGKKIQDSEYYQEYSYEVQSKLGIESYETDLKEITHVAGTKVFGKFNLESEISSQADISRIAIEFNGVEEESEIPSGASPEASILYVTADTTRVTTDAV